LGEKNVRSIRTKEGGLTPRREVGSQGEPKRGVKALRLIRGEKRGGLTQSSRGLGPTKKKP